MSARESRFLRRPIWRLVLEMGLPMALGMAGHALFNLVDLALVGRLGEDAVAAAHVATTINFLPMIVGNAVSVATMALMAQYLGAGQAKRARLVSSWSQALMLVLGIVLGVLGAVLAAPAVDFQGIEGAARDVGVEYLVITSLGTVTMFALMQSTASMRAQGEVYVPLLLLVGANLLNLVLDIVLMFGWPALGIPALGAVGAAHASVFARLIAAVAGYLWLVRRSNALRLGWIGLRPPVGTGRRVLELGVPNAVQMFVRVAPIIFLTRWVSQIAGQAGITALGITTRLDTMVLFAAVGFASAGTAVAGQNFGARQPLRVRQTARQAGWQALVFGGVVIACFAAAAPILIGLFLDRPNADVLAIGTSYLWAAAWAQPLAAFTIAVTGAINGAGRMVPPMLLDAAGYLLLLVPTGSAFVAFYPDAPIQALWGIWITAHVLLGLGYWLYVELVDGWLRPARRRPDTLSG